MIFQWLLVGALGIFLAHRYMNYFGSNYEHLNKGITHLAVGILSARDNFDQRAIIRKTWLNSSYFTTLKNGNRDFKAWFIVGEYPCKIPPPCRRSRYECSKWELDISAVEAEFTTCRENEEPSKKSEENYGNFYQGFSFHVNHPVIVLKLGVFHNLLPPLHEVTVSILDLQTKETIVNATLSKSEYDSLENGFLYKDVEKFILPKGYQGLLLVEGYLNKAFQGKMSWNDNAGVLTFSKVYVSPIDSESVIFDKSMQVAPSISFAVESLNELNETVSKCKQSFEVWNKYISDVSAKLRAEMEEWNDMLFVKVIDIYRNLPRKLLLFYDWLVPNYKFDFLLKTDDDCVVDLERILNALYEKQFDPGELFVWSKFRSHWPVNYVGKWADHIYRSPVYPSFPCGGGYILSHKAATWLRNNSDYLYPYQGEDVSLGIWMAAVNSFYLEDSSWECGDGCSTESYNIVQLTPEQMIESWSNRLSCGNICTCDT